MWKSWVVEIIVQFLTVTTTEGLKVKLSSCKKDLETELKFWLRAMETILFLFINFLGPVYMVSGTQDNPSPDYPGQDLFSAHLFKKIYQPFT